MSKPRTEADLSSQLVQDRTWRLKELSDLKSAIERADNILRKALLRAFVAICYAHWEGYVRFSALKFLEHIALRKFSFAELDPQFLRNYFLPRLASLTVSGRSVTERCMLVDEILNCANRRFTRANEDLVSTKSNLSFAVFSDICLICGVSLDRFVADEVFIDILLLKRRNAIAHGEETFIDTGDLEDLSNKTVALIRGFGDELDNRVVLRQYRSSPPARSPMLGAM
jgi:MAE_28990/MAE_18760-like HEPN